MWAVGVLERVTSLATVEEVRTFKDSLGVPEAYPLSSFAWPDQLSS